MQIKYKNKWTDNWRPDWHAGTQPETDSDVMEMMMYNKRWIYLKSFWVLRKSAQT